MSILNIKNISFSINNKQLIKNISLKIDKNQYIGILGPNGAGKSTFIKLLFKYLKPTNGDIFLYNKNLKNYSYKELARYISYIPQFINTANLKGLNVYDILEMGRYSYGNNKNNKKIIDEIIYEMNLKELLYRDISSLSGGEIQKVIFSSALVQNTDILLLDESFSFLDINYRVLFENKINELKNKGKIIISVFHSIDQFLSYKDYIFCMENGKKFFYGNIDDFIKNNIADKLFNVSFEWVIKKNKYTAYVYEK